MKQEKRALLIVDDEPYIRDTQARLLQEYYHVLTAESADAAELIFRRNIPIDIILTDQRMPGRSGIELLEWVHFHYPRTVRLLMTGHVDLAETIEAINRGHVYHYLEKPLLDNERDKLLLVLRNASEKFELERAHDGVLDELRQNQRDLEARVAQRTEELQKAHRELAKMHRDLEKAYQELKRHDKEMKRLALTDPLTELNNRRMIESLAQAELKRRSRYHNPLALGLIDIDHFKAVNTKYELTGGDAILKGVAKLLAASMRDTDAIGRLADEEFLSVGRVGGEEFLVIAREANEEGARILAERIRQKVESTPIEFQQQLVPITVSIGFAVADGETPATFPQMYQVAASALKYSKETGRNRCVIQPMQA